MNNVEEICDRLVMIHHGKQVLYGKVEQVRESFGRTILLIESEGLTQERLEEFEGVLSVKQEGDYRYRLRLADETVGRAIFSEISQGNYLPVFYQQPPTLEEIFKLKVGEVNE